jgi:hypothetical protein
MNYIKQLQADVARLENEKETALGALTELRKYLTSSKFTALSAGERRFYVNTQDVLDRIAPAISAVLP